MTIASSYTSALAHGVTRLNDFEQPPLTFDDSSMASISAEHPISTIVIDGRTLVRDCLVQCLRDSIEPQHIQAFASVDELCATAPVLTEAPFALLGSGERKLSELENDWARLMRFLGPASQIVLFAECDNYNDVLEALNAGVRGYIPTSVPLKVAVEAMRLVRAGGIFMPFSCLPKANTASGRAHENVTIKTLFTGRQLDVIEAMRQGKSNKIIAYELAMAESTVKIHVRNVMRKLKAHNRTEAVFFINKLNAVT